MTEPELTPGERVLLAEAEELVAAGEAEWVEVPEVIDDQILDEWRLRKYVGRIRDCGERRHHDDRPG